MNRFVDYIKPFVHILYFSSKQEQEMIVSDKNIAVYPDECNSMLCKESCISPICQLCKPCLSYDTKEYLVEAYREHLDRGDCKRIFPPTMVRKKKGSKHVYCINFFFSLRKPSTKNNWRSCPRKINCCTGGSTVNVCWTKVGVDNNRVILFIP